MKTKILRGVIMVLGGMALPLTLMSGALATNNMTFQDEVDVEFTFAPMLGIDLGAEKVAVEVAPGQALASTPLLITVTTNNIAGYTLNAKVGETSGARANSNLVNTEEGNSGFVFESLDGNNVTFANFGTNRWGYAATAKTDNTVPTAFSGLKHDSETTINATINTDGDALDDYAGTNETQFYIGAKAADTQVAGEYTNVIVFTAVINTPPPTLADIATMQEMTPEICANTPTPSVSDGASTPQYQLKDTRDNKFYWVAKLADGNCWMTQNLDLDLGALNLATGGENSTLTPDDTNIISDWTPASTAITIKTTDLTSSNWAADSNDARPYSFDGGNAYIPNGLLSSPCSNKDITTCPGVGTLDLANLTAVKDNMNAHYHVGNYYTWTAAIAMNDSSNISITRYTNPVSTSICPKGWRLPTTYDDSYSAKGDFTGLNNAYGGITSSDSTLRSAPLFFVRAGYVAYSSASLLEVGSSCFFWSSTVWDDTSAGNLYLESTYVNPTNTSNQHGGAVVRCVAQ